MLPPLMAAPQTGGLVDGYEVGFTFDPENPGEIARKIGGFLEDEARGRRDRDNARRAKAELSWETEQGKLLSLYARL